MRSPCLPPREETSQDVAEEGARRNSSHISVSDVRSLKLTIELFKKKKEERFVGFVFTLLSERGRGLLRVLRGM